MNADNANRLLFLEQMREIDDRYIREASTYTPQNRRLVLRIAAAAACLLLILGALLVLRPQIEAFLNSRKDPVTEETGPAPSRHGNESMTDVRYLGGGLSATDGTYIFSDIGALWNQSIVGWTGKLDLRTGITSSVCLDGNCTHDSGSECKCLFTMYLYFTWNHKIFHLARKADTVTDGTETFGSWHTVASYDAETGEYRTYDRYFSLASAPSHSPVLDGDTMYVKCHLPIVSDPKAEEDFRLCFCATDLVSGTRTVLFTVNDCPTLAKTTIPLFVADGYAYFYWSEEWTIVKISLDGKEAAVLREHGTVYPCFNSFGAYYYDGWIYGLGSNGTDAVPARFSTADGTAECLGDEAVYWMIVTDQYIYYQPKEPTADGKLRIRQMDHDGSNDQSLTETDAIRVATDAIFAQGGLYLWQGHTLFRIDVESGDVIRVTGDGFGTETTPAS